MLNFCMRAAFLALCLGFFCPVEAALRTAEVLNGEPVWTSKSAAYGDLTIRALYLEAPSYLIGLVGKPSSKPRWAFANGTEASVRTLFQRAGIPADIQGRLLDPAQRQQQDGALIIFPTIDDLVALTSEMRSVVYPELAKCDLNEFHQNPIFIIGADLDDWLRQSKLSDKQKELFRKMLWRRGRALAFSDLRTLLLFSQTPEEVTQVFKTITRTRTLLLTLRLPPNADISALTNYWSGGFADADTLPMLQAANQRDSVTEIDVLHLMPALARRRLYTYPTLDQTIDGRLPDCHWTSLNFYNNNARSYYLDTRLAAGALLSQYDRVNAPYRFGDVLAFISTDSVLHSCVYIADDIVYTKNGENILAPWVFQRMDDVMAIYQPDTSVQIQGYRLKPELRAGQR
jgi:hypothetical protein